jgi:hypothetical protein
MSFILIYELILIVNYLFLQASFCIVLNFIRVLIIGNYKTSSEILSIQVVINMDSALILDLEKGRPLQNTKLNLINIII